MSNMTQHDSSISMKVEALQAYLFQKSRHRELFLTYAMIMNEKPNLGTRQITYYKACFSIYYVETHCMYESK